MRGLYLENLLCESCSLHGRNESFCLWEALVFGLSVSYGGGFFSEISFLELRLFLKTHVHKHVVFVTKFPK